MEYYNASGNAFSFDEGTSEAVKSALYAAYIAHRRVRIWCGEHDGAAWPEVHDVTGYVRSSTGWKPCMILVHSARGIGGAAILTACIVRIDYTSGGSLYIHPFFTAGYWTREQEDDPPSTSLGFFYRLRWYYHTDKGEQQAIFRFRSGAEEENYIQFLLGNRYRL